MAAHPHSQDGPSDPLRNRHFVCSNRCFAHMGEQPGLCLFFRNPTSLNLLVSPFAYVQVTEMTFEYTNCDTVQPSQSLTSLTLVDVPKYSYQLRAADSKAQYNSPQYAFIQNSSASLRSQSQCVIQFEVPSDLKPSILLYYKLTNFYQNHRRYVNSLDADQLKGKYRTSGDLKNSNCKPVAVDGDKVIYPCGLIANSLFNGNHNLSSRMVVDDTYATSDTFSGLTLLNPAAGASSEYTMSESGIAWPGEAKKYVAQPNYQLSEIVPPPNWRARYPDGYTESNPPPNLKEDEHFQNWMRTAGLPTFTKLYSRNDQDTLLKGKYQIVIDMSALHRKSFVDSSHSYAA